MKKILSICLVVFCCFSAQIFAQIPVNILVQISKAEDELRFDKTLEDLMKSGDALVRARAALASGRTGREAAIPVLINLLEKDSDANVRATAAFALGEIESGNGADALLHVLKIGDVAPEIRASALEAAGKIAAVASADKKKSEELGAAILTALDDEGIKAKPDGETLRLGITAILRARPANGEFIATKFLTNPDARIRADAANTLSRLRAKNASVALREMLFKDKDPIARANAARALGAAEDAAALDLLLGTALNDEDARVRVSAIRSLGSLKDAKAADKLLERGENLLADYEKSKFVTPTEKSELLEIATTLGRLLEKTKNVRAIRFLDRLIKSDNLRSAEFAVARIKISQNTFREFYAAKPQQNISDDWQTGTLFQLFGEFSALEDSEEGKRNKVEAEKIVRFSLTQAMSFEKEKSNGSEVKALPNLLRSFAAFKSADSSEVLTKYLKHFDVFVRAASAELLNEQSATKENVEALKIAFGESLRIDKQYNDAQLAILDALFKLDKKEAVSTLSIALDAPDYLIRKKAFELLRTKDLEKDSPGVSTILENALLKKKDRVLPLITGGSKLGVILNTNADYFRAVSRRNARAILTTEKGSFTIEFFPEAAPLTVDNIIKLARAKYFDGLAIHRVVPNFVMQDGDPRGDGNGGPGWEIRDEMNMKPYERGAVGMALSGKDTGGSQWFVTHSPQPHLDGGYTVFGRVSETDMKIVDNLVRGDKISSVKIIEGNPPQKGAGIRKK